MIRLLAAVVLALTLSACGQAASESDVPLPATDSQTSRPGDAVAQASVASAAEAPAAFRQCQVCHSTRTGENLIGPSLGGIHGKRAGAVPGYAYSAALKASGLTWNDATLDRFIDRPMAAVPGTKMVYAGLKDPEQRRELIAYLKTI